MDSRFDPPAHLSVTAKALWREVVPRQARSAGRLALVQAALEAMDRAEQARLELAATTLTTTTETTKAVHVHPLLKVEREARAQFARIWTDLGLNFRQSVDGIYYEAWLRKQEQAEP